MIEPIAVKSKIFTKLFPIYLGLDVIAWLAIAVILFLRGSVTMGYIIIGIGVMSLLGALALFFLVIKKRPQCYIARDGDKLIFDDGFICSLRQVNDVYYSQSKLFVIVGENTFCYQYVNNPIAVCEKIKALVEESRKEYPNFDKVN